jgi:hypothetical protein
VAECAIERFPRAPIAPSAAGLCVTNAISKGTAKHDRADRDPSRLTSDLERHPYDTARVVYRICSIDGFVAWEGNAYAVPYDHVTDILPVRITQHELFVYGADLRCIARHELAPRGKGLEFDCGTP